MCEGDLVRKVKRQKNLQVVNHLKVKYNIDKLFKPASENLLLNTQVHKGGPLGPSILFFAPAV